MQRVVTDDAGLPENIVEGPRLWNTMAVVVVQLQWKQAL